MPALLLLLLLTPAARAVTVRVGPAVGAELSPSFASFGWEMDGMKPLLPATTDPRWRRAASHLAPAMIRVGGITGDWQYYAGLGGPETYWPTKESNFTLSQLHTLLDFFNATGLTLMLMLNELHGRDCNTTSPTGAPDWCSGEWDTSNARALLSYIHDARLFNGATGLLAFELGNELIGHLDAAANVADIKTCAALIQEVWADAPAAERPPLFAPSTDACSSPAQMDIMRNVTGVPGVAGFTFHGYPGGSGLNPPLKDLLTNATWLRHGIMTGSDAAGCLAAWDAGPRQAGLQLLLTEASSSWAWDLPPPAQDSFLHTFFTLAELGQYAATGVGFVARWAFSEASPFATLRVNASAPAGVTPAADYWALLAHKASVGRWALASAGDDDRVLVFAHCGKGGGGALALTAVNPGAAAAPLSLRAAAGGASIPQAPRLEWVFTAPGGNVAAREPSLNGGAPLALEADGSLPGAFAPLAVAAGGADIALPPLSASVFLLQGAGFAGCA